MLGERKFDGNELEKEGNGSGLVSSQGGERKRLRKREEGKEGRETQAEKTSLGEGGLEREGKGREISIELETLQLYGI